MGTFTKWLQNKVKPHDRGVLFRDVLSEMTEEQRIHALHEVMDSMANDHVADIINTHADRLNNLGYDWGVFRVGDEVR